MAKVEDLKQSDRIQLLDLFVHNEKVVTRIFELIFPSQGTPDSYHPSQALSLSNS